MSQKPGPEVHQWYLQKRLRIDREDQDTNNSILEEAATSTITVNITQLQLEWTGQLIQYAWPSPPKVFSSQLLIETTKGAI